MQDPVSTAVAAGAISIAAVSVITLVLWVVMAVARWRVFTKMGEAGWKAFIPLYSLYILLCRCWNKKGAWSLILGMLVCGIFQAGASLGAGSDTAVMVCSLGQIVAGIYVIVMTVRSYIRVAKAFGHGTGFGIGLWLLPHIFTLILGFDSSAYIGSAED